MKSLVVALLISLFTLPCLAEECRFPSIGTVSFELPEGFELTSSPTKGSDNQQWAWSRGQTSIHLSMLAWKRIDTPLAKLDTPAYFEDHYKKAKKFKHISKLVKITAKEKATYGVKYGMRSFSNASWGKGPQLSLYTDRCMIVLQVMGPDPKPTFESLLPTVRVDGSKS